jgi:hypothetical protein
MITINRILIDNNNTNIHNCTCNFEIEKSKINSLKKSIELNHVKKTKYNKLDVFFIKKENNGNKDMQ